MDAPQPKRVAACLQRFCRCLLFAQGLIQQRGQPLGGQMHALFGQWTHIVQVHMIHFVLVIRRIDALGVDEFAGFFGPIQRLSLIHI